ncbi:aminoglycoside phosphotransferase family protein [Arthrobacter antibioticus]|uniref:aminoglycoside phosphotransferase family protein n=1 Tax=Arthrobacter sp. H35-MC1 TaxID=3046203 RepID=UPI0024B95BBA|nr:aminoglycoside phosphotransferase family protein [Arthrobacter sp. H35-MC1]MDJ0318568.1 aminoglycoside phosphotransferase family protein [Arthrobacter sp. H35-MC1]
MVRTLLREQHPDLAEEALSLGALGWDNQMWRLGEHLAVRLPWATDAADDLILKENSWLPRLTRNLPLAVPMPQRVGKPSELFPRPWSITTWVVGEPADKAPIQGSAGGEALAAFLTAFHQPAPSNAPVGRDRAGALVEVADRFVGSLSSASDLGLIPEPRKIRAIWDDAVSAEYWFLWAPPAVRLHGDLYPANVITTDSALTGVIDFGDLCAGNPAFDLAAAWILLPDRDSIGRFKEAYCPSIGDETWRRARGWAIWRAVASIFISEAGKRGEPGGKVTWGAPALRSLRRLVNEPI